MQGLKIIIAGDEQDETETLKSVNPTNSPRTKINFPLPLDHDVHILSIFDWWHSTFILRIDTKLITYLYALQYLTNFITLSQ